MLRQPPPAVPEADSSSGDDSVFTPADWANVLKGYRSQYVEHDFWVDASMIEGACCSYFIGNQHSVQDHIDPPLCKAVSGLPSVPPSTGDGQLIQK